MTRRLRELSDPALSPLLGGRLRVGDVLAFPAFRGARVVAGEPGLSRTLARVNVMQVPTAAYARPDELVLAATSAFDELDDPVALVGALGERGVAALAAHRRTLRTLGAAAAAAADERALPVIELPARARLNLLLTELLETLVASQTTQLRMAAAVRDELIDLVVSDAGLERLVGAIAGLASAGIAIVDADGRPLAVSGGADADAAVRAASAWLQAGWSAPADTGDGWIIWPILAAGSRLGCVAAQLAEPYERVTLTAVQSGARTAAFELIHRQQEAAAVTRLTEQFVRDLLIGALDPVAAGNRASAVGWDTQVPYRVLLARSSRGAPDELADAARDLSPDAIVMTYDGDCLVLASSPGPAAAGWARALAARSGRVRVGLSAPHSQVAQLPVAYAQAKEALSCAQRFDRRSRWREFDPLSPLRIVNHVPVEQLRAFERDTLAPLDGVEPDQREALVSTLALLMETGLNLAETARRGDWHYNTVRYRVGRLTDLFGPFMEDGARLDSLALALLLRRELGPRAR